MARRRILYLAVLLAATVFYWAYQKWLGWLLLVSVLCLPVLSLVLSLPALFALKIRMECPTIVQRGDEVRPVVSNRSWLPVPMYECFITVCKPLAGKTYRLKSTDFFPTEHCGTLECAVEKVEVSDYLGLFRFRLGTSAFAQVIVRPRPTVISRLPRLQQELAVAWRPKPGGGFAENHEVRLYRPGDNLNQIHWKLSAKTGNLMLREPMIPMGQKVVVGLCLFGTDEVLDLKFDRLMGVCGYMLDAGMACQVHAISAAGTSQYVIRTEEELIAAVDELLGMEPAADELRQGESNACVFWIGGAADEE